MIGVLIGYFNIEWNAIVLFYSKAVFSFQGWSSCSLLCASSCGSSASKRATFDFEFNELSNKKMKRKNKRFFLNSLNRSRWEEFECQHHKWDFLHGLDLIAPFFSFFLFFYTRLGRGGGRTGRFSTRRILVWPTRRSWKKWRRNSSREADETVWPRMAVVSLRSPPFRALWMHQVRL